MAKQKEVLGKIKEQIPNLEEIYLGINVRIDSENYLISENTEFCSRPFIVPNGDGMYGERYDFQYIVNQYRIFLSTKDWLKRYWHLFSKTPFDTFFEPFEDEESETAFYDEIELTFEYFFEFKDESQATMRFSIDGEHVTEDFYPFDEKNRDSMAAKAEPEFTRNRWDMDIDTLQEKVTGRRNFR